MQSVTKKRIGILRGGTGEHYHSSLKKGGDIISYISENLSEKYKPVDIFIDQDHAWHLGGLPVTPGDLVHKVDLVWNTSHPSFSNIIDSFSISHVGAGTFLGKSRDILREHIKEIGVNMPRYILLPVYQRDFDGPREKYAIKKAKVVFEKFGSPWIVKSFTSEPDMGVHLVKTFNELVGAIEDGVKHQTSILVEEFIVGKVASLHSVPNFRGEDIYIFPVVNIFGDFSFGEKEKLTILAKNLHNHIGAKHYLKSDFVVNKRGKIYLLDFESIPNLKPFSSFSKACESVGAKMHQVVEHMIEEVL